MFHIIETEETLPNFLYKSTVTLIPKPYKDSNKKDNYRPILFMNMNAKLLSKILVNQIQEYIKMIKLASSQRYRAGSTYENLYI